MQFKQLQIFLRKTKHQSRLKPNIWSFLLTICQLVYMGIASHPITMYKMTRINRWNQDNNFLQDKFRDSESTLFELFIILSFYVILVFKSI